MALTDPDAPLDDDEFAELAEFLVSDAVPESTMSIVMLDGFLTALASGPGDATPARWLPWVWDLDRGQAAPELPDKAAKRIGALLLRLHRGIALALADELDEYEPLFAMHEDDEGNEVEVPDEWCAGYLKGIELDRAAWQPLVDARPELFRAMRLYGTEEGWKTLEAELEEDEEVAYEAHAERLDEIVESTRAIAAEWRERGAAAAPPASAAVAAPTQRRDAPKVGRNDPCPCGSGRKYKQCHGAG